MNGNSPSNPTGMIWGQLSQFYLQLSLCPITASNCMHGCTYVQQLLLAPGRFLQFKYYNVSFPLIIFIALQVDISYKYFSLLKFLLAKSRIRFLNVNRIRLIWIEVGFYPHISISYKFKHWYKTVYSSLKITRHELPNLLEILLLKQIWQIRKYTDGPNRISSKGNYYNLIFSAVVFDPIYIVNFTVDIKSNPLPR